MFYPFAYSSFVKNFHLTFVCRTPIGTVSRLGGGMLLIATTTFASTGVGFAIMPLIIDPVLPWLISALPFLSPILSPVLSFLAGI